MKTFREITQESLTLTNINKMANDIDKVISKYDDSLSTTDFAKTIANILINQYGSHNFDTFREVLEEQLKKY
jgi:hypothetical protein